MSTELIGPEPWPDHELMEVNTHRDNVNPDEDLHRVVQRDSPADFAESAISSFVKVLLVLLGHFVQAEPTLRVHKGASRRWRREVRDNVLDDDVPKPKNGIHLELADESLLRRPVLFSGFSTEELVRVYPVAEVAKLRL